MRASILTVNFRSKDHLGRMLESLRVHECELEYEVIVVNNDPSEDLSDLASESVRVLDMGQNRGFAYAVNRGLEVAAGEFVALINPDVIFIEPALSKMLEHLDLNKDVGIAGPRLLFPDGSHQPSVRLFPRPLDQWLILLKIPHLFEPRRVAQYLMTHTHPMETQDVDQIMGAFFVMRREMIEMVGAWDERFFLWFEEVDYCKRAHDAGWKIRYDTDATAQHVRGASFSREATRNKQAYLRESIRRYMRKYFGWKAWLLFTLSHPMFWMLGHLAHFMKRR
ncbi:MAG: dTDP-Rha:a-D-GlcNAc-diphosphoryl polyprenol, a-3-L-rhamnosyl transferase [Parcubacteria group bacterium GW2011_GWA2_56_7]|nr:MAG: dTDP-Rha:a-D-GlcNAc-diphosphoryl polyprenol, a-3-L-rhamnosyl transferase [Parcubacteria group bacterium GW2011_GWA2_56_7]